jgi:hypothetical protein
MAALVDPWTRTDHDPTSNIEPRAPPIPTIGPRLRRHGPGGHRHHRRPAQYAGYYPADAEVFLANR